MIDGGFLTWRKRLEPLVEAWFTQKRDPAALLRGGQLAEAQRRLTERLQDLDDPEREFIKAGLLRQAAKRRSERRRSQFLLGLTAAARSPPRAWRYGNRGSQTRMRLKRITRRHWLTKTPPKQRTKRIRGERTRSRLFIICL